MSKSCHVNIMGKKIIKRAKKNCVYASRQRECEVYARRKLLFLLRGSRVVFRRRLEGKKRKRTCAQMYKRNRVLAAKKKREVEPQLGSL